MRTLRNNKQTIKYAELIGSRPIYEVDENGNKIVDYVDSEGNVYYVMTGEEELLYTPPKTAEVNISFGGNELQAVEFGIDISAYDATILYLKNEFPISDTSIVWFESEPKYKNGDVDPASADYKVLSVKPSLNYTKALLGRIAK